MQRELIDELHCLVTQAAVCLKNEGRELDAEGRHYGSILRNLRLFSGRGSAKHSAWGGDKRSKEGAVGWHQLGEVEGREGDGLLFWSEYPS